MQNDSWRRLSSLLVAILTPYKGRFQSIYHTLVLLPFALLFDQLPCDELFVSSFVALMLTERGKLAIAELVFYTPALFLAIIVTSRHGFGKQSGWVYLALLALIRVVGSILELVVMSKASVGLVVAATILSGIGLSPLLLAMLGLLQRV